MAVEAPLAVEESVAREESAEESVQDILVNISGVPGQVCAFKLDRGSTLLEVMRHVKSSTGR